MDAGTCFVLHAKPLVRPLIINGGAERPIESLREQIYRGIAMTQTLILRAVFTCSVEVLFPVVAGPVPAPRAQDLLRVVRAIRAEVRLL